MAAWQADKRSFSEHLDCAIVLKTRMKELSLNNCRLDKRYDVVEQLGRGSYSEIFIAHDTMASPQSPHHTVVIKALNVFLQDDLDADLERTLVENFQNEAIALDRVRHPNIISRLGHGTARDLRGTVFHYLVLEYLAGGDVQNHLRKQKLSLAQALKFIEQICAGIGHAHRHSIIHRDIKPQNLLLTADLSAVKIADFGVARVNISDAPITRVGTNIYAPPEHSPLMAGNTGDLASSSLTPAADIYSLAKTIYTMLSGEAPRAFANASIDSVPHSIRSEKWAEDLVLVLKRATSGDPQLRQQSVEELWGDLAAIRDAAADGEYSSIAHSAIGTPQPHVSRGYTPIAPERPSFDKIAGIPSMSQRLTASAPPSYWPPTAHGTQMQSESDRALDTVAEKRLGKRTRTLRRLSGFLILVVAFTGILYGTASFVRGRITLPGLSSPFTAATGVASTDVYLRRQPNTDQDPIGLVTKNSRVRIVKSQNNWYQVDVVQQGRTANTKGAATRGWLNGRYLEID